MRLLVTDVAFALRLLRRRPLIAAACIATLALGIGASAAVFRVVSTTYLQPLPFANEERLVRLYVTPRGGGSRISVPTDVFVELREQAQSFTSVAAQHFRDMTLETAEGPQRVTAIAVSAGWAATLGLRPVLGRTFLADEERQGLAADAVLLSHALWRSRFAGAPDVIGRVLRLDGAERTIVGVLAPGLRYPYEADVWLPMAAADDAAGRWSHNVPALLRPGVSVEQLRDELARLSATLPALQRRDGMTLLAVPLREELIGEEGRLVVALFAATALLMLLICANLAHLLLVGTMARRRELATRAALGASLRRQLAQLLTEGGVLALLGAALGLPLAWMAGSLLDVLLPRTLTTLFEGAALDPRTVLFALALAALAAVVFSAAPLLDLVRRGPGDGLAGAGRETTGGRTSRLFGAVVVSELALALLLIGGAGALAADLALRRALDLGYEPRGLLTLNVALNAGPHAAPERRAAFLDAVAARMRAVPGVATVGTVNTFPAEGQGTYVARVEVEGRAPLPDGPPTAHGRLVSGEPFTAMRLALLRGRLLDQRDRAGSEPVCLVSRSLAALLWPQGSPLGARVRSARAGAETPWMRVVGVVDDVVEAYDTPRALYMPHAQHAADRAAHLAVFVVRTSVPPETLAEPLRRAVCEVDPGMAVFDVASADQLYAGALAARRSAATLARLFAAVGLVVAVVGVYATMAFAVGMRRREISIRLAMGAQRERIVRELVSGSARLVLTGLAAGAVVAALLARLLARVVEPSALAPGPLVATAAALGAVALLAAYLPARRAARVPPIESLRAD